jgi:hypothetical protein
MRISVDMNIFSRIIFEYILTASKSHYLAQISQITRILNNRVKYTLSQTSHCLVITFF